MIYGKALWRVLVGVMFLFVLVERDAKAELKIGFLEFSPEVRYGEARKGILDQLAKAGYKEPNVRFVFANAGGSKMKAAELVQKFVAEKMDMVIPIGTNATIAVTRVIKDRPIVFSMVYDPVEAHIAKGWKSSGNNTTGSSARIPMAELVGRLKEFGPIKSLGVLYTPGEKNSEVQLTELKGLQAASGIRVIPVIITQNDNLQQTLAEVIPQVDALYLSGSSVVGMSVPAIVAQATKAKIVTVTHLDDLIEKGVLLGISADPYQIGSLAGKKAVKVLKGTKPSEIPIEYSDKLELGINLKTVKAGQFKVSPLFMGKVTRKIE